MEEDVVPLPSDVLPLLFSAAGPPDEDEEAGAVLEAVTLLALGGILIAVTLLLVFRVEPVEADLATGWCL